MEITRNHQGLLLKNKQCLLAIDSDSDKADILISTKSLDQMTNVKASAEAKKLSWPGEFEVRGVSIHNYPLDSDLTDAENILGVSAIIDGVKVFYVPSITKSIKPEMIEKIGDVDLLVVCASIPSKILSQLLEEIEPKAILPLGEDRDLEVALLKDAGINPTDRKDKHSFQSRSSFNPAAMDILLLN